MFTIRRVRGGLHGLILGASLSIIGAPAGAQDANIPLPVDEIELQMTGEFQVLAVSPSRGFNTERTYRLTVQLPDGGVAVWKLAPAPRGGESFNNRPDYELAAYHLQKLFLDESGYVVPPTVARAFPTELVEDIVARAPGTPNPVEQTFPEWRVTLAVQQYWLNGVDVATKDVIDDQDRFESDAAFARHASNFNLLTHLIRHSDSNDGNFMISMDPANPRIFAIDNGVAFSSEESDRGTDWRDIQFDRFPASSIERLRALDLATLERELGILAEFELQGGAFVAVAPSDNLDPGRAIRRDDSRIQIGLRGNDIRSLHRRITDVIERVDSGRYGVLPGR